MRKHLFIYVLLLVIFLQLFRVCYFNRSAFLTPYNAEYWKDRYEHSQYSLPLSERIIGDDGVYAYAGYRLIKGDNPITINVDKPPLGKYLIGLSILISNTPAYYALVIGVLTTILYFLLAKKILKNKALALLVTTIVVLDPLYIEQFWSPWIDMPQLLFIFLNFLLLILFIERRKTKYIFLSGLALGLFAEIKSPVLFIPLLLIESICLFWLTKKNNRLFAYGSLYLGVFAGVVVPYIRLFALHYSILDILRFHKFIAAYYMDSKVEVNHIAFWQALIFGQFPGVNGGQVTKVMEWTIIWPLVTIGGIFYSVHQLVFEKKIFDKIIPAYVLSILLIFTFILSYPRYYLLIFPFLVLLTVKFLSSYFHALRMRMYVLFSIGIFLLFFNSNYLFSPRVEDTIQNYAYSYSHLYFKDIYEEVLSKKSKQDMAQDDFNRVALHAYYNAAIEKVDIKVTSTDSISSSERVVEAIYTYKSRYLGSFSQAKQMHFVLEDNRWKLLWNWDNIFNDFTPDSTVSNTVVVGKRGSITDSKGNIIARDADSYILEINPQLISLKNENVMLKTLEKYTRVGALTIQNRYNENPLPKSYIPVATLSYEYTNEDLSSILLPGVRLRKAPSRLYSTELSPETIRNTVFAECCSRIYSSTNYHGVKGPEKEFDSILSGQNGGKIELTRGAKATQVIEIKPRDGQDIILKK